MDKPLRILIFSVSAGYGHIRAAQAVEKAGRGLHPGDVIENFDALDYTSAAFKKLYGGSYLAMVNHIPSLWGYLYEYYNRRDDKSKSAKFSRAVSRANAGDLVRYVNKFAPDVIVCTHFFPAEVLSASRKSGKINARIVMTITDFDTHAFWVQQRVDHYFAGNDEVAFQLRHRGISDKDVSVTGIPIDPVFSEPTDAEAVRGRLGLDAERPVVLLLKGGFGVGGTDEIARALLDLPVPIQLVAIAGKNEELREKYKSLEAPSRSAMHAFGFVNNIQDYMGVSDLVVTKSGGLTVSECLAKSVPMVVTDPIPGQEDRNCDYLLECGAALKATGLPALCFKVERILKDRERLEAMKKAVARIARPRAAHDVVEISRKLCAG